MSSPFQACRVHADRRLDQYIRQARNQPEAALHAELKTRIRAILYAADLEEATRGLQGLLAQRGRFREVGRRLHGKGRYDPVASIERNFSVYMTHHRIPGMPADNNITENVIKQLGKKLALMEGFASLQTAERYLRLLIGCYRLKPFTDSNHHASNGKTPLNLAGIQPQQTDWLTYLQHHKQTP